MNLTETGVGPRPACDRIGVGLLVYSEGKMGETTCRPPSGESLLGWLAALPCGVPEASQEGIRNV